MDRFLGDLWSKLPGTISRGLRSGVNLMVREVVTTKLTDDNPPYLNRRTGNFIRSVGASPSFKVEGSLAGASAIFSGQFGSNLDYARKHEEGGTFTEQVRAHTRVKNRSRAAEVRAKTRRKKFLTASQLKAISPYIHVRAHTRTVTYRARHMFGDTMKQNHFGAARRMRRALDLLHKNRRIPTLSEIAGGG
ncbi:MAG TPA: hypothetical protein VGK94_07935 [Candidatus Polarisedimenticolia bacterium]|jgi:hypothetical protein